MPNFNSISSGVSEPQVAKNRHFPLTTDIAFTTVYALTCYTVVTYYMLSRTTAGQEMEAALLLQPQSLQGAQLSIFLAEIFQHYQESIQQTDHVCSIHLIFCVFIKQSIRVNTHTKCQKDLNT